MLWENLKISHLIKYIQNTQTQQKVCSRFYTRTSRSRSLKLNNQSCKNKKTMTLATGEPKPINWSLLQKFFVPRDSLIFPNARATYDFFPPSPRRQRTHIFKSQMVILKEEFQKQPYITKEAMVELSLQLKLPLCTVQVWFQNQRQRSKLTKESFHRRN